MKCNHFFHDPIHEWVFILQRPKLTAETKNIEQHSSQNRKINKKEIWRKMRNMNRVFFCKSLSLVFLVPSFTRPQLRFTYSAAVASFPNRAIHCMATDPTASFSSVTGGVNPVSPPSRNDDVAAVPASSASSAIDFLTLCTRLKVM